MNMKCAYLSQLKGTPRMPRVNAGCCVVGADFLSLGEREENTEKGLLYLVPGSHRGVTARNFLQASCK